MTKTSCVEPSSPLKMPRTKEMQQERMHAKRVGQVIATRQHQCLLYLGDDSQEGNVQFGIVSAEFYCCTFVNLT
jgi:hypothetical protein